MVAQMWPAGAHTGPELCPRLWFWNPYQKSRKENGRGLCAANHPIPPVRVHVSCGAVPNCSDDSCSALSFAFQTEMGSALHEAALFGKTDVVQILLAAGERSAVLSSHSMPGMDSFALASLEGLAAASEPSVCVSAG